MYFSGPTDVSLNGVNTERLSVTGLHVDESVGSPTVYEFMLTVVDYRNLTDTETVFIIYRKGIHNLNLSLNLSLSLSHTHTHTLSL